MAKRQATLLSWSQPLKERRKGETSAARSSDVEQENSSDSELEGARGSGLEERDDSRLVDDEERRTDIEGEEETMSESTYGPSSSTSESTLDPSNSTADSEPSRCSALCCITTNKTFQPTDKQTLVKLTAKNRHFQPQWYRRFPWISVCNTNKKVYCLYCRYATQHNLISFSRMGEKAFTETGFHNWRKAIEKFAAHDGSHVHREAKLKWMSQKQVSIQSQISSQMAQLQITRRQGFLFQLKAIVFLTRQGIAIRGHTEAEGNLPQLLRVWGNDNEVIKSFLRENRYTSHQSVNELIEILGHSLLHSLLKSMKEVNGPAWFSIIADEATDVTNTEQLNVSIRWVSNDYEVREDPIGLCQVPDTKAETLFKVIKDLLIRCNLPLALCRGQST